MFAAQEKCARLPTLAAVLSMCRNLTSRLSLALDQLALIETVAEINVRTSYVIRASRRTVISIVLVSHARTPSAVRNKLNVLLPTHAPNVLVMCERLSHNTVLVLRARTVNVAALVVATTAEPNSLDGVQLVQRLCYHKVVGMQLVLLIYAVLVPASTILALTVHPILVLQMLCAIILSNALKRTVVFGGLTKRKNSNFKFQISNFKI